MKPNIIQQPTLLISLPEKVEEIRKILIFIFFSEGTVTNLAF